jgi:hypothetical protein
MSEVPMDAKELSFIDLYSRGDVSADTIEDYIDRWHDRYREQEKYPPLHEYLGLTREEYEVWLYDPLSLPSILRARQPGGNLADIMTQRLEQLRAANRQEDGATIFSLGNWLKGQASH